MQFRTGEDALFWLTRVRSLRADFMVEVRSLLSYQYQSGCSHLSDHRVLEEAALLLHARRLVVICQMEQRLESAGPSAKPAAKPFPLGAAAARPASASPAGVQPPTFSPGVNFAVQAASLMAAAQTGVPFCPE